VSLETLRSDWDDLAERDALWAILTDASKAGGRWNLAEFLATGDAEVETALGHLERSRIQLDCSGAALDFGCGVGRLTVPLAKRFASCVGIDISSHMIEKAEAMNRNANCRFIASSSSTLPLPDSAFAFIYSNIVLQHIPAEYAVEYLREFVRVLAPGGVLVFGVQDSYLATDIGSAVARIRQVLQLRSRFKRMFGKGESEMQMHFLSENEIRGALGSAEIVDIQFTNTAARDFNGRLVYSRLSPRSGFVSKQYSAVKPK
jgi:ubiquinone/menaquinone biosynthesis C-methylase UbiE